MGGVLALAVGTAHADEGMWTFDQFPSAKVGAAYGFTPGADWLKQLQLSSLRIAGGCSASVVSPNGLVMTNHHCARECVQDLGGLRKKDFNKDGFIARTVDEEARCNGMEMNQLVTITDVTQAVQAATRDVAPDKFNALQRTAISGIEKDCATSKEWRCDVVTLFRGGQYHLYKYRRLQDIRLVFSPEDAIANFGGDPDNFNFPRYAMDAAFLRIYGADGKPWKTVHFLPFAKNGIQEGDLTFVPGSPGGTSRGMTVAQLEDQRDKALPRSLMRFSHERGWMAEYQKRGKEPLRHSNDDLLNVENTLKDFKGQHEALADSAFFASLQKSERDFRSKLVNSPALFAEYGDVWDSIAAITQKRQTLRKTVSAVQDTYGSNLMGIARSILRHAEEKTKPNGDRLPEFADARLPQLEQGVLSDAPIYKDFEIAKIRLGLARLREDLSPDHPLVKKLLGNKSPEQVATELVRGTKLGELKTNAKGEPTGGLRKTLWDADSKTLAASKDPMLKFVASFDAEARAARKRFEDEVQGPLKKQEERLAKARFAVYGSDNYPDATFTPRLSFGRVVGWLENGVPVVPFTDMAGAYRRHTGAEPFALPASWLKARGKVNMATPFNLVTNNDIIGGNSGSPLVNKNGEVVGLVFDGNIHSLGGEYGFDEKLNRTVAVDSRALLEALDHVYPAAHIATEIRAGQK